MKKAVLYAFAVWMLGLSSLWAAAPQVAADTYTNPASPTTAFGGLANLLVTSTNSSYVRFNLGSYAGIAASDINHAYVAGFVRTVNAAGAIQISSVTGTWDDTTQSGLMPAPLAAAGTFNPTSSNQWVVAEITGLVQSWIT